MSTELLAIGSSAASSPPQTLTEGQSVKLLFNPSQTARLKNALTHIDLEYETSSGTWVTVGKLGLAGLVWGPMPVLPSLGVSGKVTYRVTRPDVPADEACGVDITS